jgi:hypothetical protein
LLIKTPERSGRSGHPRADPSSPSAAESSPTKAEAEAFAADLASKLKRGYIFNIGKGRHAFDEYADEWLGSLANLYREPVEGYQQRLDRHVLPMFGAMEVRDIWRKDCEDYVRTLIATGLTPPSITTRTTRSGGSWIATVPSWGTSRPTFGCPRIVRRSQQAAGPLPRRRAS